MTKRRTISRAVALAVVATLLAACGDATAPQATSLTPSASRAVRPSFDIRGYNVPLVVVGDTTTAKFTVKPDGNDTFVFDRHNAISFPAGAICEPTVSTYGPTEWDKPCAPAERDIEISVKAYRTDDGHMRVDFQPALRFNPASEGVTLYLEDYNDGVPLWFKDIVYCNDAGVCVDESIEDPSLKTYDDAATGLLGRRVKHFSGYSVAIGRASLSVDLGM